MSRRSYTNVAALRTHVAALHIPLSPRSVPSFAPFKTCCYRVDAALPRDSDAMRPIILHYLLFKNAGTTIEETLDHSFRTRFQLVETANASGIVTDRDLLMHMWDGPGALAVSRHQIRYPTAAGVRLSFLRYLLSAVRLRYFHDYFRQWPDSANPISRLANECAV